MSVGAWGLGVEWEQDERDALTFRRRGAVVTFDEEGDWQAWVARSPAGDKRSFHTLAQAMAWADLTVEPEDLPPATEDERPPHADPAALVRSIQAVLADPNQSDASALRAITALLRVVP